MTVECGRGFENSKCKFSSFVRRVAFITLAHVVAGDGAEDLCLGALVNVGVRDSYSRVALFPRIR
jgi:hypothetical protein